MRQERTRLAKPLLQKIERAEKDMAAWQAEQAACEAFLAGENAYLPEKRCPDLVQEQGLGLNCCKK